MATTKTKRPVVPGDVKAARKLLDEIVWLRSQVKELKGEVDRANRTSLSLRRQLNAKPKARPAAKAKPKAKKASARG